MFVFDLEMSDSDQSFELDSLWFSDQEPIELEIYARDVVVVLGSEVAAIVALP